MSTNGGEERSGREVRLLALVIVIAVAGLLVLARFRFPTADIVAVSPTPSALERLAVKAPFQELSNAVADAAARVNGMVLVVDFEKTPEKSTKSTRTTRRAPVPAPPPPPAPARLLPGLRVRSDLVMTYAPSGWHPVSVGGVPALALAVDARREVALLGADSRAGEHVLPPGDVVDFANALAAPATGYALAVEGGAGGPATRPFFIPRIDPVTEDRWLSPILRIGGDPQVSAGSFLFTIDGRLIGLTVEQDSGVAIVPAPALGRLIADLTSGHQ